MLNFLLTGCVFLLGMGAAWPVSAAVYNNPDSTSRFTGISVRTNLLWDIAGAEPNLGVEVPVGTHVSLGANAGIKTWPRYLFWDTDNVENTRHWRNFAVVPEVRYYLDQVYDGVFFGADFLYTHFNVGSVEFPFGVYPEVKDERAQGSYWAGGLFAGYSLWLGQHWRAELEAGVALGLAAYDRFGCEHCGNIIDSERKAAVVPKLGVNLSWNPVGKDQRPAPGYAISGHDTLTVLSRPVAFVVHLKEVEAPETTGDRLSRRSPWVIPIEKYRPLDYLTRPGRDSILTVQYPLDSHELKKDFADNGAVLEELTSAIEAIRKDDRTSELLLSVVGLASIEGPKDRNDTLSVRRARAVAQELSAATGLPRRSIEIIGKGEAWDWFRAQVAASPEGFSEQEIGQLQEILSLPDEDQRERSLKASRSLYNKVAARLLQDQRNAGYIRVYYGAAPDAASEKYNGEVMNLLKAKKYAQAVQTIEADSTLLGRTAEDPEALNAYAVALYFTALDAEDEAREKKALDLLEKASAMGSEAARQNLQGAAVYGPALREYQAWKQIMEDDIKR